MKKEMKHIDIDFIGGVPRTEEDKVFFQEFFKKKRIEREEKNYIDLDIDYIGGGPAPTAADFKAISDYIKAERAKKEKLNATQCKKEYETSLH